jgi:hypothetical protein
MMPTVETSVPPPPPAAPAATAAAPPTPPPEPSLAPTQPENRVARLRRALAEREELYAIALAKLKACEDLKVCATLLRLCHQLLKDRDAVAAELDECLAEPSPDAGPQGKKRFQPSPMPDLDPTDLSMFMPAPERPAFRAMRRELSWRRRMRRQGASIDPPA